MNGGMGGVRFNVREVQPFIGKQVVLWLNDESGSPSPAGTETQYCIVQSIHEMPALINDLVSAYAQCMQEALVDVAAGGCRRCGGQRKIFSEGQHVPCPVCIPRAEDRIRSRVMLRARP